MAQRTSLRSLTPATHILVLFLLAGLLLAGCKGGGPAGGTAPAISNPSPGTHAVIETDHGTIEFEFYEQDSPRSVENFRLLARRGYYDGLTFHRIIKGFMLQGGDPQGDGSGGESAWGGYYDEEIQRDSPLYRRNYQRGVVAMANAGPGTNNSQFFIMHQNYPLPAHYVIFGQVTKGIEVVDLLAETPTTRGPDRQMSRPTTPPVMRRVTIKTEP
jgi:cyclophilin family peptidyl-prolyl cis-trans isomerase